MRRATSPGDESLRPALYDSIQPGVSENTSFVVEPLREAMQVCRRLQGAPDSPVRFFLRLLWLRASLERRLLPPLPPPESATLGARLQEGFRWFWQGDKRRQIPPHRASFFDDQRYPALFSLDKDFGEDQLEEAWSCAARLVTFFLQKKSDPPTRSRAPSLPSRKEDSRKEEEALPDGEGERDEVSFPSSAWKEEEGLRAFLLFIGDLYSQGGETAGSVGVHYTPAFAVRFMLEKVWALWGGDTPSAAKRLPFVLDPAMGTGRFLIEAALLLGQWLEERRSPLGEPTSDKERGKEACPVPAEQEERLAEGAPCLKRRTEAPRDPFGPASLLREVIVAGCLFGVDQDPGAVDLARLSLWWLAGDPSWPICHFNEQLRLGDSLSQSWPEAFPKALAQGGFDLIAGNPPYCNLDRCSASFSQALKERYPEIWMGQADLYYFFVALTLRLLRKGGAAALLVSRYMLESHFARGIRQVLLESGTLQQIFDLQNLRLFPRDGIDNCILLLHDSSRQSSRQSNEKSPTVETPEVLFCVPDSVAGKRAEESLLLGASFVTHARPLSQLRGTTAWSFARMQTRLALERRLDSLTVGDLYVVGMGMQTGLNRAFELEQEEARRHPEWTPWLRQRLRNSDLAPYSLCFAGRYWLDLEEMEEEELRSYPALYQRMLSFRPALERRVAFRRGDCRWYRYAYPRYVAAQRKPKLITPYISRYGSYVLDPCGEFVTSTDTMIVSPRHEEAPSLLVLCALLNSFPGDAFYQCRAKLLRDGLFSYAKHPIEALPLPASLLDEENKEIRHRLASLAQQLHQLSPNDPTCPPLLQEIDQQVVALYQLSSEEEEVLRREYLPEEHR